jgi:hypothetical protein
MVYDQSVDREFVLYKLIYELDSGRLNLGVLLLEAGDTETSFADMLFRPDLEILLELDPNADLEYLRLLEKDIRNMLRSRHREYIDSDHPISRRDWILSRILNDFSNLVRVLGPVAVSADAAEPPAAELLKQLRLYTGARSQA